MRLGRDLCHLTVLAFIAGLALWPHAASADPVTPARIAAALPKLEALAQAAVADGAVPGLAIGVVHDDKVIFLKGFGHREAGRPEPVDADT
ncbi:MAG: beta-lactamase family protein, partial [Mesorhizobium sp.]